MEHERAIQNLAVESYLLGEMTPQERESFEEHYFECSVCAEDLKSAHYFVHEARNLLAADAATAAEQAPGRARRALDLASVPEPVPAAHKPKRGGWFDWLQPQWAATAIAALVLVVAIQNLTVIPGLRQEVNQISEPQVLHTNTLRPVTRGDATPLTAQQGKAALLAFDLDQPPPADTPLHFVIESRDGAEAISFDGSAPEPDQMVNVAFPALKLAPGDYTLVAYATSDGARKEVGRYPFTLQPR